MAGYQEITIVGNLGRDAELRYLQTGVPVLNFSVAVNTVSGSGETRRETTTWFRVAAWRELGERLSPYLTKGKQVLVVGTIATRAYIDNRGELAASLELTADRIQLLCSRDENEAGEQEDPLADQIPF